MKPIADISPDHYYYELPEDRIALFPAANRDESHLLIREKTGRLHQDIFKNIANYLAEGSHIFFNNSKVIPARLIFTKETGSRIEIFCLKPSEPSDYALSLASTASCSWECMVGNLKRFSSDSLHMKIMGKKDHLNLYADRLSQNGNIVIINFRWDDDTVSFADILLLIGQTPLPPYIKRKPEETDRERYQTIYSKFDGSVAAPTAGLHFTDNVFETLNSKNIFRHEITLHVGAGTFQPIKAVSIEDHLMHTEYFNLTPGIMKLLAGMPDRVTCVGTTSVRTLESIYWLGVKVIQNKNIALENLHINQWDAYTLPKVYTMQNSFEALGEWLEKQEINEFMVPTRLMIVPGYGFKVVDTLITNFHQPRSTLLLLIAAFIGESWKETYNYALNHGFRFLSYGDSSLLFNQNTF